MNTTEKTVLKVLAEIDAQRKTRFEQYTNAVNNQDTELYQGFYCGQENGLSEARNIIVKYFIVEFEQKGTVE